MGFTMSSALGMNLMPPTSAFQHGLQQAAAAAAAAATQQSQQSSETNLDRDEHEPSSQDSTKAQLASEHNIAATSNVISDPYDMDSDSELQARRSLSHEEDDIDDRDVQADIDNEDND